MTTQQLVADGETIRANDRAHVFPHCFPLASPKHASRPMAPWDPRRQVYALCEGSYFWAP